MDSYIILQREKLFILFKLLVSFLLSVMVRIQETSQDQGGWRNVGRKNSGRRDNRVWDVADGRRRRDSSSEVKSFFITEFGEKWKAKDLFFEFKELGRLMRLLSLLKVIGEGEYTALFVSSTWRA